MNDRYISETINYWIAPISDNEYIKKDIVISILLKQEKIFGINNKNLYKGKIKKNDLICFYLKEYGIIGKAKVMSSAFKEDNKYLGEHYGWLIKLSEVLIFLDKPIKIDENLRTKLDAFRNNKIKSWGWFVQTLHSLSSKDYNILTENKLLTD